MNEQSETVTEQKTPGKRGRKAGSKNLPIPEAWLGVFKQAGETKGALAEALGVSYPTLRKAMSERAPSAEEAERVRIVAESAPDTSAQASP